MNELLEVGKYACGLAYESLPEEVIEAAKVPIIDCLGVTVAGLEDEGTRIAAEWVQSMACGQDSTVFYGFGKSAEAWAAMANGTAAHALDFDDVSFRMMGHPSVALVPAILAVGETLSATGEECILSYVVGLEVAAKTGAALGGNSYMLGWHHTSILGALGAAASCGKLLGLSEEQMACALGISCSLANGLRANFGTMTKPLHAGMAAMNGVMAARLAARGFTSNPNALYGESGFARAFSDDPDKGEELLNTLGEPYELIDPGLSFKPYPCCRGPQGAIDAALAAREEALKEGGMDAAAIEKVECRVQEWLRSVLTYHQPRSGTEGKFSLEFCVTSALLEGRVGVGQFRDEVVTSPPVVETISRFDWQDLVGEVTSPFASEVTVTFEGGRKAEGKVDKPLGEPGNPMSEEQIFGKYLECVGSALDPALAERTLEMLRGLESLDDIGELVKAYKG